jgi:hypothetical protein
MNELYEGLGGDRSCIQAPAFQEEIYSIELFSDEGLLYPAGTTE